MSRPYTGSDLLVDALERYGVTHLFGNPGTTELPIMQSLAESDLEYVLGLHEDIAVGAAAGYATHRRYHHHRDESVTPLGVVNLHLAGGLAHGLGNVYNASLTGAPLLVTAGTHSRDFQHEEPILSGDLVELSKQFTKWSAEVKDVAALPTMLRRAVKTALTPPTGPVFLAFPVDVMLAETDDGPEPLDHIPRGGRGDPAGIDRAASLLADADEPVFVVGDQLARAGPDAIESIVELAEATGASVYGEVLLSEVAFPTDHEQWVTFLPTGEEAIAAALETDTLVFAGCSTNTTITRHERDLVPPEATTIHLGHDAWELGKNEHSDCSLLGDPGLIAADLADAVADRVPETERERRQRLVRKRVEAAATDSEGNDEHPSGLPSKADLGTAMRAAAPEALIVNESVTAGTAMRDAYDFAPTQYVANKGGGLGYGLPAAIGAAIAQRQAGNDDPIIGYIGDGSYYYYLQSLYTAVRNDVDVTIVVPNNRNYRILKHNTAGLLGGDVDDYEYVGMDFEPELDISREARAQGATAERVETADDIEPAIARAVEHDGPAVVDVLIHD